MEKTVSRQVLELLHEYDGRPLNKKITLYTDLKKNMGMPQDDAGDFLEAYFSLCNLDPEDCEFLKYFPNEGGFLWPNFLIPKEVRPTGQKPIPLTVKMLLKSAKAGRWLYD